MTLEPELSNARALLRAGRFADAEQSYQLLLAAHPNCIEALVFLGNRAQARGDFNGAVNLLSRASNAEPANVHLLIQLGVVYRLAERLDAARYVLERATRLSAGRSPLARMSLAEVLELDQRPDLAMLHYHRALVETQLTRPANIDNSLESLSSRQEHARNFVAKTRRDWFERVFQEANHHPASTARVRTALDIFLSESQFTNVDPQERGGLIDIPGLATAPFINNGNFGWLDGLQGRISACMEEVRLCISAPASRSHVKAAAGALRIQLIKAGVEQAEGRRHAPKLLATLRKLPLADVLHHAPNADIIALNPGARIPRHCGRSNSRCWAILNPLQSDVIEVIVQGQRRLLQPETVVIADPSFGIEYVNLGKTHAIALVFDVDHPDLNQSERYALAALLTAVVEFDTRIQELD